MAYAIQLFLESHMLEAEEFCHDHSPWMVAGWVLTLGRAMCEPSAGKSSNVVTEERKDRETEISGTRTGLYINERGHTFAGKSGCNL